MTPVQSEFIVSIDKHKGIIFKVSKVYFDHPDDQEDLRQEIIYQLWHSFDKFRNESQFSTWMYRIAINTAILFFKKEKRRSNSEQEFSQISEKYIEDSETDDEKLKLLYASFQQLDKIEKAIIFMYLEGMDHEKIAANLGITNVNARVKLHRTKEKIKSIIFKTNKI